ncbi:MAG: isocitrate/isopropylmalate dehydrogenase family protein [Methanobacteriota archaeon]|nr:MAG: isocitrate/isopropylmalate dehydrogenase family protein [Euryarchaeota archaeon]
MKTVCILPGDGIGPEVIDCARRVIEAATDDLEFVAADIGAGAFQRTGRYLPDDTLTTMKGADTCLFGAVTSERSETYDSPVIGFGKEMDLFANVRPVRDFAGVSDSQLDVVIVRENSEGLYTMDEVADDAGVTTRRRVSLRASERIVRHAIVLARSTDREGICCVHKANVLRRSDGLFLKTFSDIMATEAQDLRFSDQLVDSAAARLVSSPSDFDVIVTLNLYGDILSDVASAMAGGLGFAPSGNIGPSHSVFEPAHGSAPDIAGRGIANPTAAILAGSMMLGHIGMASEAKAIYRAVFEAYATGNKTVDIGGAQGSSKFTEAVISKLNVQKTSLEGTNR